MAIAWRPLFVLMLLVGGVGLLLQFSTPIASQAAPAQKITLTFLALGSDAPLANQTFWVLERGLSENLRQKVVSDDNGKVAFEGSAASDYRLYASGRYFIPYSWSRLLAADWQKGEKVVYARTMETLKVTGKIIAKDGKAARFGTIEFAPLDMQADGTFTSYDRTYATRMGEDGSFDIELPSGYYDYWANWADKDSPDWDPWFYLKRGQGIFENQELNLTLKLQPMIEGRVIDGRTGDAIDARVDLVSTEHLAQKRLTMLSDRQDDPSLKGQFRDRLHLIDENNFSIIVRAADSSAAVRVYSNLSLEKAKLLGPLKLYDPEVSTLRVGLFTKQEKFPLTPGSIRLLPSGTIEAPTALREELLLLGYLDDKGYVEFSGLPKGTYAVYTRGGRDLLGDIEVNGKTQKIDFEYDLSFIFGTLTYPDGTAVKHCEYEIRAFDVEGNEYPPQRQDALRNPWLAKEKSMYLAALGPSEIRYVLTFGAPDKDATELPWDQSPTEMRYISEEITVRNDKKSVQRIDVKLKLNPNHKTKDD